MLGPQMRDAGCWIRRIGILDPRIQDEGSAIQDQRSGIRDQGFDLYVSPRVQPPSTGMVTPLMYDAAGEARNATTSPNSFGSPIRPIGIPLTIRCSTASALVPSRAADCCESSTTRSVRV